MGTPGYMAPEQASGQRRAITTATDVYGLGAILYALLTGRPPFEGDRCWRCWSRCGTGRRSRRRGSTRGWTGDLETICLKCLEKDPRRRYDSAAALADDLERYLARRADPGAAAGVGASGLEVGAAAGRRSRRSWPRCS